MNPAPETDDPEPYASALPIGMDTMRTLFLMGVVATGLFSAGLVFEVVIGVTRIETRYLVATVLCVLLSATATKLAHRELKEAESRADARDRIRANAQHSPRPPEWQPQGASQPFAARPLSSIGPPPAAPPPAPPQGRPIGPDNQPQ